MKGPGQPQHGKDPPRPGKIEPARNSNERRPRNNPETHRRDTLKYNTKRTEDGLPVHSFATLLADLATLTLNKVHLKSSPNSTFMMTARPTPVQRRAFELLDLDPDKDVAMYLAG